MQDTFEEIPEEATSRENSNLDSGRWTTLKREMLGELKKESEDDEMFYYSCHERIVSKQLGNRYEDDDKGVSSSG